MTIRELHETTPATQKFYICEDGIVSPLNRDSVLALAAYGDYVIATIEGRAENELEITIKTQPVKKEG